MEFGLNSDSEVFSYMKRPVLKRTVKKCVQIEDVQDSLKTAAFAQPPSRALPAEYFTSFLHEPVARAVSKTIPEPLLIQQNTVPEYAEPTEEIRTSLIDILMGYIDVAYNSVKSLKIRTFISYRYNKKNRLYKLRRLTKIQASLYTLAVILFIAGLGISIDGWRTNTAVHVQVNHLTEAAAALPEESQPASTNPQTPPPTSASNGGGSSAAITQPDVPKTLKIPAIKVNARVMSLGLLKDGSIATPPPNTNRVGWYNASSKPGNAGAMIIDGHVSGLETVGVFYRLKNLNPGDTMTVERGDGQIFTYQVVKSVTYPADAVDMTALANPVDFSKPGLNLITCGGNVKPGTDDFDKRVVVFTVQI